MITGVNVVGKRNSVANTTVYLPNKAILKWSVVAIKLGGWPKIRLLFIHLPSGSSVLFKCKFSVNSESF